MSLRENPAVKAYVQHGFSPSGENDTQIWGTCSFCESADKMYVNKQSKMWDCKHCSRSGGYLTFLQQMHEHCVEQFNGAAAIQLSKMRGISPATFRRFGVGYNSFTGSFTIPIVTPDGSLFDLRIYKSGKLLSTYGCRTGMLNWGAIEACGGTVWLCEGEWDCMAMQEVLTKLKRDNDVAIGVPGAGTFKGEWVVLFREKTVRVLYDNDEAGQKGAVKVFNSLKTIARDLKFLNWRNTYAKGYDVRDLYNDTKSAAQTFSDIEEMLADLPSGTDVESVMREGAGGAGTTYTGEGLTAEEVYNGYREYLHLPDVSVLDVLYGTVIANRMPGDPLWLFLVAPSGMTKTELLMSISDAKNMETVTTLTPATLVSGANLTHDPSLIPRLNGKVLIVKDFTTILQMNQQAREEIFGILRDAYDGEISKMFGHGVFRHYRSRFGVIAGVTPAIEVYLEGESALGERFLRYGIDLPKTIGEQIAFMSRAASNVNKEGKLRDSLKQLGSACLDYQFSSEVGLTDVMQDKTLYLALWVSMMRGTVIRDKYTKEVLHSPIREIGTRLSKQFTKLLMGMAAFHRADEVTAAQYAILRRLARTTVPSQLERIVRLLHMQGAGAKFTEKELSGLVNLPDATVSRQVVNLHLLGMLEQRKLSALKREWSLSEDAREIINHSEVYA